MNLELFENLPENNNLSIDGQKKKNKLKKVKKDKKFGKAIEFRGDICPSCGSGDFSDEKCRNCGYGCIEEVDKIIEEMYDLEEEVESGINNTVGQVSKIVESGGDIYPSCDSENSLVCDLQEETENGIDNTTLQVSKIIELRGDICPSCDSENFSDEKCRNCGYGLLEEVDEIEEKRRRKLSEKNSKNGKKYEIFVNGERIEYFHYKSRIKKNEATLEIKHNGKKFLITVGFEKSHHKHFQDNTLEYDFLASISLKEPKNFDGKHKIIDAKTKKGVYFDYNFAEKIAKEILNKKF